MYQDTNQNLLFLRMEFIITNVTDEEIEILEREDFDWYPDTLV